MKVYRSNRVEALVEALGGIVGQPTDSPLRPECIVVQSRSMATWLSQRLAERRGVWMGADFPFPRRFVHRVFEAALGPTAAKMDAFGSDRLLWSILAILPAHLEHGAFAELARFVADDPRGVARFSLARRIAQVFDQYLVFRPDMLLRWESGEEDHWQARLWRALVEELGPHHLPGMTKDLFDALARGSVDFSRLPSRVSVFGLSTLPPIFVRILSELGRTLDVHLLVVSPSREWWAELKTHRERLRSSDAPVPASEAAPALLTSLGKVGRDFQAILEAESDYQESEQDLYRDPTADSLLHMLQSDILRLHPRGPSDAHPTADDDDSICIMACHSPMREVEVLHDRLLGLLERDPTLQPRDIVVMMSDVQTYAPLVEAVFERDPSDPTHIPYNIADRTIRGQSPSLEAFHRVLDLAGGRVTASEVLDLLALEPLQRNFGYSAEDVDTLTTWVEQSGIRWGVDGRHRKSHGQPELHSNTWRFGLDRLLLGLALPSEGRATFADVLPYDDIEGQDSRLLGQLAEMCERLFALLPRLEAAHRLPEWQEVLGLTIERMLGDDDDAQHELQPLRTALSALVEEAREAGFDDELTLPAIRELLDARVEDDAPARGYLAGGVTVCAMLPMRTIPFRVVALLGLGDTDFPRSSTALGFDLMVKSPRRGDRSRRDDDRYLFLEALLSARDRVLITYVGQSIVDNGTLPPSVVVSELLDDLELTCRPPPAPGPAAGGMHRHVVLRHPMQPFSPRYFGEDPDPRLYSYERVHLEGALALQREGRGQERAPLLVEPLPPIPDEARRELALSRLIRFFRLPAAELLKRRLGVYLDDWSRDRTDREPMELDPLDEWKLGQTLLQHHLEGLDPAASLALLRAGGDLPLGTPGEVRYEGLRQLVDPLASAAGHYCRGTPLPPLDVDLSIGPTRVMGSIAGRWPRAVATPQYARLGPKHLLAAWIQHLTLCACAPHDQEPRTVIISRADKGASPRIATFGPVEDPQRLLGDLVELYWIGQSEPLLLFPRGSFGYATTFAETGDPDKALLEGRRAFTDRRIGDRQEPHVQRLFGSADVLAEDFQPFDRPPTAGDFSAVARRVFAPLLEHLEEEAT